MCQVFGLLLGGCSIEEAALGVVQGELEGAAEGADLDLNLHSVEVDDVNVVIQTVDMADTPHTPDTTATLVGDDDSDNGDDSVAVNSDHRESREDDNQHSNGNHESSRMVLGAGASTAVGARGADTALRSHANDDAMNKSQRQREKQEGNREQTEDRQ